ncbi:flagellar protein [Oryzomicrobium terrae]|uniref:Flagellar protein n=1 Tax=Oryzomicrobium terrae TaxID=1735038 RepID=A0A5C1E675_9RHOO|nr:flagellar protein FlaG [Oryzomicrobium terrae]QEL64400.1 flagellar protein [Oryzomicrobium terrae]
MNVQATGMQNTGAMPQVAPAAGSAAQKAALQDGTSSANTNSNAAPGQPASKAELNDAAENVQKFVNTINSNLSFQVDDDTGEMVVKVVDATTKDVIRQIPSEEMLAIAKALDRIQGLLVNQKA